MMCLVVFLVLVLMPVFGGGVRRAWWVAALGVLGPAGGQEAGGAETSEAPSALAAQSLCLEGLLGDVGAMRPATLAGSVWTFEPQPGRTLVVLPIAVDPEVSGVTLEEPAFSPQGSRFVAWMLPGDDAGARRDAGARTPSDAELLDTERFLAPPQEGDPAQYAEEQAPGYVLPEGAPRAARSLELVAGGRVAWEAERALSGTIQASSTQPTMVDAYRLKLDPAQVRAMRPERPARPPRTPGEDRRTYDLRVRQINAEFRTASEAFRRMSDAVRGLPVRFEAQRPGVVLAVFEVNAFGNLILRGHPAGRWAVSPGDLEVVGRLAASSGGRSGGGDGDFSAEAAADLATLLRVASDAHPWAQRAAARALAGSGYLTQAAADPGDPAVRVALALLDSADTAARRRAVFALTQVEPVTAASAALLALAAQKAGNVAVDAAAVRALLVVEVAGDQGHRGTVDLPAVVRVLAVANELLAATDGPDGGAVVRELLAATGGAASGGRGGVPDEVAPMLVGGLGFTGLAGERFDSAAVAVIEAAPRHPVVAGGWLNRHLLGSADPTQVHRTLDLLDGLSEPAPAGDPRSPRLEGGLPLDTANHALLRVLNSGDAELRGKAWRALPWFVLSDGQRGAADGDSGAVLEALLNAGLARAATPESLAVFLDRQPDDPAVGDAVTRALVRVTAEGDSGSARRAAGALLGSGRDVARALDALDADGRARFVARLYDRLEGSLSPVTGLIRAEGSALTRFLGEALGEGVLPPAAAWAEAAGREQTLFGYATGDDEGLARAAIAALAAQAGANTPQQLAAVGAFQGRRRALSPADFGAAWAAVRQVLFTARLAEAAGDYRMVVILRGRKPAAADGGGLTSDPVLGTDPGALAGGTGNQDADAEEHQERWVLGVVELVADGGAVRLGAGTPAITVPDDRLAIRLPSPGDLKNLEVDELQDLPLERIDGPLDLLPDGQGGWGGDVDLVDGRRFELRLEPHDTPPAKGAGGGQEGVEHGAAGQASPSAAGGTSSGG